MSGDLFTLRMMVVAAADATRELWRGGTALASLPIELTALDSGAALAIFRSGTFDVAIVDGELPAEDHERLINAARRQTPPMLVAGVAAPGSGIPGVDIVFARPGNADQTHDLVERCIRLRMSKRVLIVDDSKTMRSIVRKILSASRFVLEVSEAEEGIAALKKLGDRYDVVLLDYNMPGFNGIQTLSQIKQLSAGVEVVIMTSTDDEVVAARAKSLGAAAFL
jgi:CheY-like chemotaxis protein